MTQTLQTTSNHFVEPTQLCIGLHVHLDLSWSEHPFAFSSFKIKSADQIATLRALGLKRIRYSPSKSSAQPSPAGACGAPAPDASIPTSANPATLAKQSRLNRQAAHRAKVAECERALLASTRTARQIDQQLATRPEAAQRDAQQLVGSMADSMLLDADIAIHLMADKIGNEQVYHHALNTTLLAMMLGRELKLAGDELRLLGLGAMLHDAGKAQLPARIAKSSGKLTPAEAALLHQHGEGGLTLCARLNLPTPVQQVIAQHHEHADGTGYPKRMKLAQIGPLARIVSVVNQFDNLCNPADPAKAMTPHEAIGVLHGEQRTRYDTQVLMTFVRCMGIYPPGTIVWLSNGTLAVVTAVNSSRPLKPTVMVYDPNVPKESAMIVELEHEPDVSITRTSRPQQLTDVARQYLAAHKRTTYYFHAEPAAA